MVRHATLLVSQIFIFVIAAFAQTNNFAQLRSSFRDPPADCRVMMRWWWFGPSVTKPELERELRAMKDAGIGGVEIQPVYPLALDDPSNGFHNFPYLSSEFIDDLRFASDKGRELGMRLDLTLGSGWPYGGPHISVTQAAGRLRVVQTSVTPEAISVAVPDIATGEQLLAAFSAGKSATSSNMLNVSEIQGGRLSLNRSPNSRTITWFISSRTGMMVKRPAVGAEGFVLDHFDRAAIDNHLRTVGDQLLSAFGDHPPYAVFSDSLEVYDSDWTPYLLQEFQKRRGYDLIPYLPALVHDVGPQTSDIRHDWGETLTELINERYLTPIREWAAQHGTRFRSQTYGIPAVSLSSNRLVDLPEGEGDQLRGFSPTRWASSASHLYQKNITSSETWTWLHSPAFRATPLDMKADADRFFLEGVNQIVGHGWPYSRPGIPQPGWSFYAAGAFDDHNPWWPVMPEVAQYLQRVSYVLRQGTPANDVALLLPTDDAWSQFTTGHDSVSEVMQQLLGPKVIPEILDAGFNFDFIDAEAIDRIGIPYHILVLPGIERLPAATYQKIEDYARNGGIVIATRRLPSKAPGFIESPKDSPRVRAISQQLFASAGSKSFFVPDERQLADTLTRHFTPDVSATSKTSDLGFVHRVLPSADIYFLVNTSNRPFSATVTFRTRMRNAEWWDPFTGEISHAPDSHKLDLKLDPYESRVLVFSETNLSSPARVVAQPGDEQPETSIDLATGWSMTFPPLHRTVRMKALHSWSDDEPTRYYSGSATYERSFNLSSPPGKRVYLDFGPSTPTPEFDKHSRFFAGLETPIRDAAQILVNDQLAGFVWKPPYRIEITQLLHSGENHLRIVVYNTAINELAGRAPPDYRLLNSRYGERFTAQDIQGMKPLPSGLLTAPRLVITSGR